MIGQASVLFLKHRVEGDGQMGFAFLIVGAIILALTWFYDRKETIDG